MGSFTLRRAFVLGALLSTGCGEVVTAHDAQVDCGDGMHAGYTGKCEPNCSPTSCDGDSTCNTASGACEYRSCFHLAHAFPAVGDGPQLIRPVASEPAIPAYCSGLATFAGLGFGDYNDDLGAPYAGWDQLRVADLQTATTQKAFVYFYNKQVGLKNLATGFRGAECCFKSAYDGPGDLEVNGGKVTPAALDGSASCGGPYTDTTLRFAIGGDAAPTMLPDGYFSSVKFMPECAEADNPAFYVHRFTGLASCRAVVDQNLFEGLGFYMIDPDGLGARPPQEVVCDKDGNTIDGIGVGLSTATYPDYQLLDATLLADPAVQLAILQTYGRVGGLPNLDPTLTVGSCCFALGSSFLGLGGMPAAISHAAGGACTGAYTEATVRFSLGVPSAPTPQVPPLKRDFFTIHVAAEVTGMGCTASANPALFVKRH